MQRTLYYLEVILNWDNETFYPIDYHEVEIIKEWFVENLDNCIVAKQKENYIHIIMFLSNLDPIPKLKTLPNTIIAEPKKEKGFAFEKFTKQNKKDVLKKGRKCYHA